MARDVVDRLFRIERGALPAGRFQRVDDVAAHLQHAALEDREQPDRAGADDRDIGYLWGRGHRLLRTGCGGLAARMAVEDGGVRGLDQACHTTSKPRFSAIPIIASVPLLNSR